MTQSVKTTTREPEQPSGLYEESYAAWVKKREQTATGAIVVRSKDTPWEVARQGRLRYFCHMRFWHQQAAPFWHIFEQDIRRHSGKHVHQGGLVIFVLEGKGYTIIDGIRYDWEKGDLMVLPIKPGGVEHQHFNSVEGESCHWMAFVYKPQMEALANELKQRETSSEWNPS